MGRILLPQDLITLFAITEAAYSCDKEPTFLPFPGHIIYSILFISVLFLDLCIVSNYIDHQLVMSM